MRSSHPSPGRRLLIAAASASLALATLATTVATAGADTGRSAPPAGPATDLAGEPRHTSDNFATAKQRKQDDLRQKAVAARLNGKKWAQGDVVKFPNGQSVDLSLEETDRIFTVLVEFGDQQYPDPVFQGPPQDKSTTDVAGPQHNQIPEPDREVDNSTLWQADYNRAHYENMYFERMAEYYETQSSGRYTIDGAVTDWVKVPFNEALYGRNYCGDIVCATSKALVRDALAMWVDAQKKAGMTIPQIYDYLKTFDVEDRYDVDDDGNYDEPDGVIDHFQIVHAGGDEAAGDPNQGTDAIWSHRSGADLQLGGPLGVGVNVGDNGGIVASGRSRTTRPACGSTTTPSSPRTAAWACSPTSSATTSACPTSTTPRATPAVPRTTRRSGPSCPPAPTSATGAPTASATTRPTWAPGSG